jgi:hypothetical protein
LRTLALDMMHADFDLVTGLLGYPDSIEIVAAEGATGRGSAAEVVLAFPDAFARCSSSSLMPQPYGMRGGWRATCTGAVLEYVMSAGFTGQGTATLVEHTTAGERVIELPETSPYAAMIDHVLSCLTGDGVNRIEPASALRALELTLHVHHRLTPSVQAG